MRVLTLRWAVGMFCALMGAMMLTVPHRFEILAYTALQPNQVWWGLAFLLVGNGLLVVAVIVPPRWAVLTAHVLAGAALMMLARGFAVAGLWTGTANYMIVGLGTAVAPFVPQMAKPGATEERDLLGLLLGLGAFVSGLVMLAFPDQFKGSFYDVVRTDVPLYGAAFVFGGLALSYVHTRPEPGRPATWAAHLLVAGLFLAFLGATAVPSRTWPGAAFYGGFGLALALLPWVGPRLPRLNLTALRTRVALALAVASATPLLAAVAFVTDQDERSAMRQELLQEQTVAGVLAQQVSDFLVFHRLFMVGLARSISAAGMTPRQEQDLLRAADTGSPDVVVLSTYNAAGQPIARSDGRQLRPLAGPSAVEHARRTNAPSVEIYLSPATNQPVLAFAAPIRGPNGEFAGLLVGAVGPLKLVEMLHFAGARVGGLAYVVDGSGRAIAPSGPSGVVVNTDLSETPPVAAMHLGGPDLGSLTYTTEKGGHVAGYARVPEAGWGVVVDRPLAVALARSRATREAAFLLHLLILGMAVLAGVMAAGAMTRPLEALAREVDRFGEGAAPRSLPRSGITEVDHLANVFGEIGARLAVRTAERERAHEALRAIMESTSDGILFVGSDLQVQDANRRAGELLAQPAEWAARGDLAEALAGAGVEAAARESLLALLQLLRLGQQSSGQGDFELATAKRVLHWDAQPVRGASSAIVGFTLTLQDVTQQREISQMKSDFVSFATHQLRTPLAGIKWMLELAAETREDDELLAYIQDARDANQRLIDLVNDLLDVSRLESGRLSLSSEELHLGKLTQSVLDEVAPIIREMGHRLSVTGADDIPPIVADPKLLRQVVLNLVSNAIKYTPPPGEIALRMSQENGAVTWAIRDSGIGIPQSGLPRLFQKFYRAENVARLETEGTGLGLYLVRLILERHGGRIWCESEEGKGSTFSFTLPGQGGL